MKTLKITLAVLALTASFAFAQEVSRVDSFAVRNQIFQVKSGTRYPISDSNSHPIFEIYEADSAGTVNYIWLRTPIGMANTWGMILPGSAPSAGEVLTAIDADSMGWAAGGGIGDITGVAAGDGLSGGGTSGDVTVDVSVSSPIVLSGDAVGFDFSTNNIWTGTNDFGLISGDTLRLAPTSGTVFDFYVADSDDDLQIIVNTASTETIEISNAGAGDVNLTIDGSITASNISGTNTGDETLSTSSAGIDVSDHVIDLDLTPISGSATLEQSEDALQVKYDSEAFAEGASGLAIAAGGIDGGSGGDIADYSIDSSDLSLTLNLGGHTSFEIPNGADPTTDAFGELAGDNDAWAASRGALEFFDGTASTNLVGVLASDTPSNGQVPVWNTGGTITWENQSGAGAAFNVRDGGALVSSGMAALDFGSALDADDSAVADSVVVSLLLDSDGGLETVDDSLNIKLDGSGLTLSASGLGVDDVFVSNSGDAITGNLDFNDGTTDSPSALFTPSAGTAWQIFAQNTDGDFQIQSAATASTENVDIVNPGSGAANLTVEGTIIGSNLSGTNTGDEVLTTSSAGLDVSDHAVDLDLAPSSGSATLIQEEDALQIKYDSEAFSEGASGLTIAAGGIDGGAAGDIADNSITGDDITLTLDLGGHTSFEVPNGAAPTTDAAGEIAFDNDAWDTGRGALQAYDGTASTFVLAALASDTPTDGQVAKWNTGGTITWEDDISSAGAGGDFRARDNGASISASPQALDFGAALDADDSAVADSVNIELLLDFDGGLEIADDSLNIKLNGSTLALTASGLAVSTVSGVTGADEDDLSDDNINALADVTITTAAATHILVRNAGNTAFENVAMSGDATLAATGAITVADDSHNHTTTTISGIDISDDTNLSAGTNITLTGDQLDVDDVFVLNTGDAITGTLDFNDGTTDSPAITFTPQTGTAWSLYGVDADGDLQIVANTASTENVDIGNAGAGVTNLTVDGDIAANNLSGTNTGDEALSTSSAGLDVSDHAVDLDVTPGTGSATLEQSDDALQVKYDSEAFAEGANGIEIAAGGIDGGSGGDIADNSIDANDITLTLDLGGHTSFEIPNGATPTTDAFGELAGDNNAWDTGRGAPQFMDGTGSVYLVGTLTTDTPTNGQVPTYNTGGTITWEDQTSAGDNVSIDGVGVVDPDFTSTGDIDFVDASNTITANINAGVIVNADVSPTAAIAYSKLNLADSILTTDIKDSTITNADISASAAISYSKLAFSDNIVAGDIATDAINLAELDDGADTPLVGEFLAVASGATDIEYYTQQQAADSLEDNIDHDALLNFAANEHIDHTSVNITVAGTTNEISSSAGAQDISSSRTWTLSLPATIDLGGKTSFEIPNAANPTTSAEGQIAWDSNNDALEVHNNTSSSLVAMRVKSIHATIYDPDGIQPTVDAVALFSVESEMFPFGITLLSCGIKTSASSTYSVNFEEWTSMTDGAPSTIETVATSASTEAEDDGTLTDSAIAAGSIIKVDLPATDIDELVIWITYTINEGN